MSRVQIAALLTSLIVTGFVVEQVRRRRLAVEYSLIWIVAGLGMIFFSLWRNGIEYLASVMGIYYAPSALFVIFGVLVFVLCIHFSLAISKLSSNNRVLIQRIALLEDDIKILEEKAANTPRPVAKIGHYKDVDDKAL